MRRRHVDSYNIPAHGDNRTGLTGYQQPAKGKGCVLRNRTLRPRVGRSMNNRLKVVRLRLAGFGFSAWGFSKLNPTVLSGE